MVSWSSTNRLPTVSKVETLELLQFFHFIETSWMSFTLHEEIVDLVVEVLLLESDQVLLLISRVSLSFGIFLQ